MTPVVVNLPEQPDLAGLSRTVKQKVHWDKQRNALTINAPLSIEETETLQSRVMFESSVAAIAEAAERSRTTAIDFFQTPAEQGVRLRVPQLALRLPASAGGQMLLPFDDPEVLDYPWSLSPYEGLPTTDDISRLSAGFKVSEGGEIDIDSTGRMVSRFLPELQRDLGLAYQPDHWDEVKLAAWLCRNLPEPSLTHANKQAFVTGWLLDLMNREGFTLARLNLQKFLIRNLIEARIRDLRKHAVNKAYQTTLFGADALERVIVSDDCAFEFPTQGYAPSRDYDGRFGHFDFRKHYYGRIGDFDSREEFECACWLDTQAQQGKLDCWVRNLVRREGCSFFLQKADGRFYPDFLCQLPRKNDECGEILAVEYKGADRWTAAADDRLIGGLWAELSRGRCRFVMVKDKQWHDIEEQLR
jgi:type III restriction enzyme